MSYSHYSLNFLKVVIQGTILGTTIGEYLEFRAGFAKCPESESWHDNITSAEGQNHWQAQYFGLL